MDFYFFQQINQFAGKSICLDSLGIFFAEYLGYVLIAVLFLFFLKNAKKYWPMIVKAFAAAALARLGIVELIRFLWEKPRPFIENNVNLLLEHSASSSFPSGHAAFFFALSTVIFLSNKKTPPQPKFWWGAGLLFFIASFLISISRVFCGIHWPSDVIAGAVIGIFSGWLVMKIFRKF